MPILRDTIGTVEPVNSTVMSSEVTGTVATIAVPDGAVVRQGDLLVSLDDRAARAQIAKDQAAIARDQATLDQTQRDLQRAEALLKSGAVDAQQADTARSAAQSAAAVLEIDKATLAADQVALDKLKIIAPFDGRLGAFQVSPGALVTPGAAIVTLTQVSPVRAAFTLAEGDLPLLQDSLAKGTLTVMLRPAGDTNHALSGKVDFIDNAVDPASGSISLRATVDNPDGRLVAKQAFSAVVQAGERSGLVVVPTVAVQPRQDGNVVYLVNPDDTVSIRKVDVALRVGDRTGLTVGISAGDTVVVEGQGALTDGAKVKPNTAAAPGGDQTTPTPPADATAAR
ncbi:multidrug efflux system membrane fusion protein [Aureimonas phyllosphaerae]|uniref:Multidrug efflux system membrane fusion protein n=1 Tax=Aureimonas phyllosphaerae TaxID=1166078 RepID=A0A7W6FWE9_9HYPH|nr:multidrug efflux system membrane fusion protein [Aureimonas phyllosphaerae]MBB3962301.1 multidrug efflux system membrane fusion protein [Aureimonas phyllosphaerae]